MIETQTLDWVRDVAATDAWTASELRAAVFVLRQALEQSVRAEVCGDGAASFTAVLVIYRRLMDPVRGAQLAVLWDALSHACHADAQALPPTREALSQWFDDVSQVLG